VWRDLQKRFGAAGSNEAPAYPESMPVPSPSTARQDAGAADSMAQSPAAARERSEIAADEPGMKDWHDALKSLGKLGTGHGRSEDSHVTTVAFERATESPAETVAIQYDRRENLVAMGVLPQPYYARRTQPDPFPGALRFAPDPR